MLKAYLTATAGTAIRHGLSGLGVYLVAEGYATEDVAQQLIGGLSAIVAASASIARTKHWL